MPTTNESKLVTQDAQGSNAGGADPFSGLHRMSTTAGVGSHEYVAVNNAAVVAFISGCLSLLALVSGSLLMIALLAAVFSVIALIQITRSNGTQTGRSFALLGLLIAAGVTISVVVQNRNEARAYAESRAQIAEVFNNFYEGWASGNTEKAWSMFGPAFQSRVKFADFDGFLKSIVDSPEAGKITGVQWNQRLEAARADGMADTDIARAVVVINIEKAHSGLSNDVTLVRRPTSSGGKGPWQIEQMSPLFDQLTKQPPAQQNQPPGPR